MTIIVEQAQDTRASRRINPSFRPDGGPLPHGNPKALPIDLKEQKDQSNTWNRDNKEAHRTQALLAFSVALQPLSRFPLMYTLSYVLSYVVRHRKTTDFRGFARKTLYYALSVERNIALVRTRPLRYARVPPKDPPASLLGGWLLEYLTPLHLRVAGDLRVRIEAQAEKLGCSPSEIVRRAIEQHLDGLKLLHDSSRRHLRVTEYMQVALDAIIRENHPELRETLILEADRRMKLHHGA